jgi:hypothetical protein
MIKNKYITESYENMGQPKCDNYDCIKADARMKVKI